MRLPKRGCKEVPKCRRKAANPTKKTGPGTAGSVFEDIFSQLAPEIDKQMGSWGSLTHRYHTNGFHSMCAVFFFVRAC